MDAFVVLKPCNTVNRRFKPGDPFREVDAEPPLDFETLKERKFVGREGTKAAEKAADQRPDTEAERRAVVQEAAKVAWDQSRRTEEPTGEWPIHISDEGLYGRVVRDTPEFIAVQIPPDDELRFYRVEAVSRVNRTVAGRYSASEATLPAASRRR